MRGQKETRAFDSVARTCAPGLEVVGDGGAAVLLDAAGKEVRRAKVGGRWGEVDGGRDAAAGGGGGRMGRVLHVRLGVFSKPPRLVDDLYKN